MTEAEFTWQHAYDWAQWQGLLIDESEAYANWYVDQYPEDEGYFPPHPRAYNDFRYETDKTDA